MSVVVINFLLLLHISFCELLTAQQKKKKKIFDCRYPAWNFSNVSRILGALYSCKQQLTSDNAELFFYHLWILSFEQYNASFLIY